MSNTAGVLMEAGNAYPTRAHEFTTVFLFFLFFILFCFLIVWNPCAHLFNVLRCPITMYVSLPSQFHIKPMLGSYLSSVVCRRTRVLFVLFVFVCGYTYCVVCLLCFSLSYCCQFLWIVHF